MEQYPTENLEWEEMNREVAFQKYGRIVEKVVFKMPDNSEQDYYIRSEKKPICILPITKNNEVILIREFRPGPKKVLLELPGGYMEENEDPASAVERELLEETGYKGKVQFVTMCLDEAYSTTERACFVATECVLISTQHLDENEFGEVTIVSISEFRKLLRTGQMTDVEVGYLGLDFLNLL